MAVLQIHQYKQILSSLNEKDYEKRDDGLFQSFLIGSAYGRLKINEQNIGQLISDLKGVSCLCSSLKSEDQLNKIYLKLLKGEERDPLLYIQNTYQELLQKLENVKEDDDDDDDSYEEEEKENQVDVNNHAMINFFQQEQVNKNQQDSQANYKQFQWNSPSIFESAIIPQKQQEKESVQILQEQFLNDEDYALQLQIEQISQEERQNKKQVSKKKDEEVIQDEREYYLSEESIEKIKRGQQVEVKQNNYFGLQDERKISEQLENQYKPLQKQVIAISQDKYIDDDSKIEERKEDFILKENQHEMNKSRIYDQRQPQNNQQQWDCEICLSPMEENIYLLECGHSYHRECVEQHLTVNITSKSFPIKCPNLNCKQDVNYGDIQDILSHEDFIKYGQYTLDQLIDSHPEEYSCCPTPDCKFAFILGDDQTNFSCQCCKKNYCLACKCIYHEGKTCKEYQISNNNQKSDKQFESFVRGQNFKQCSKCKAWIEKNKGCDHITCKCSYQFCYSCGGPYPSCNCQNNQFFQGERGNNQRNQVNLQGLIRNPPAQQQRQQNNNQIIRGQQERQIQNNQNSNGQQLQHLLNNLIPIANNNNSNNNNQNNRTDNNQNNNGLELLTFASKISQLLQLFNKKQS